MTLMTPTRVELDFSGLWQIAFDPESIGDAGGWASGHWPESRSQQIQVPEIWNIAYPDAEGVGFYRKVFDLPTDWEGKTIQVHFDGISYRADVWLNGRFVGAHLGAYTPFMMDVSSFVNFGAPNELIVRVASLSKTKDVDGMVLQQFPTSKQGWYYIFGGIWGKVVLEALPMVSCESVSVDPDLQQELVQVEVKLKNSHSHCCMARLRLELVAPDGDAVSDQSTNVWLYPGINPFVYRIDVPRPVPWDCDHPCLYQVFTEVEESGGQADRTSTSFGMRDFTVKDGEFFLNGAPIFLRGVILQPHYPVNLVTPPDLEMMAREIRLVKEAGFNLIRVHLRPAPPGYLELADRMGVLVYAESTLGWIRDSLRLMEHGRREIREMVTRDRNHPSVVIWGIYNENRAAAGVNSETLVRFTRSLDPTRVIVDNSGGTMALDQDFGWVDRATVVPGRETERQEIQDLHLYLGGLVPERVYAWERALGKSHRSQDLVEERFGSKELLEAFDRQIRPYRGKVFVSELGCGGMCDLEETVSGYQGQENFLDAREMKAFRDSLLKGFFERGLERIFGSVKDLVREGQELQAAGNTRHIEALLLNPRISGYFLTQLNDVAWEFHAGILDLWRNPKLTYTAVQRLNQPHVLILNIPASVVLPDCNLVLNLTLLNRVPLAASFHIAIHLFDPNHTEAFNFRLDAPESTGINPIEDIRPDIALIPGKYKLEVYLRNDLEVVAEASRNFWVLPPVEWDKVLAHIRWVGERPEWALKIIKESAEGKQQKELFLITNPGSLSQNEWEIALQEVTSGQTALIGSLQPQDEATLSFLAGKGIPIRLHFGIGNWMGCYHWIPSSPLFSGLPSGGLAGEPYVDVRPYYVMSEMGGEVLAGSFRNTQTRREPAAMLWYSDMEKIPFGKGCLIFCQYRIFDTPGQNPLADRLLANLLSMS